MGVDLFHGEGWTHFHDEANSRFFLNFAEAPNKIFFISRFKICGREFLEECRALGN